MNVLVTGGAGFIGSNLVRCLVASGDRVTVLDDLSGRSLEDLVYLADAVELIVGDVRDRQAVDRAMRGVDVVYHLAAVPPAVGRPTEPRTTRLVIAGGTLNILLAARDAGVRRVVNASSSLVYGETQSLPQREDQPGAPWTPFAASKLTAEGYCWAFTRSRWLETVTLRLFNAFGPRHDRSSRRGGVVARFVTRMLEGRPPVVYGDGRQTRDLTYVANVIQACMLAGSAGPEAVGQIVNVGGGGSLSVLELIGLLNELLGTALEPVFGPAVPGDVRRSEASIARAELLLGYRPLVGLRQGLELTLGWTAQRERRGRHVDRHERRPSSMMVRSG